MADIDIVRSFVSVRVSDIVRSFVSVRVNVSTLSA